MEKFILYLVKELVAKPDIAEVETKQDGKVTIFVIKVAKSDLGKVIGKNGNIISAIRTLSKNISTLKNKFVIKVEARDE